MDNRDKSVQVELFERVAENLKDWSKEDLEACLMTVVFMSDEEAAQMLSRFSSTESRKMDQANILYSAIEATKAVSQFELEDFDLIDSGQASSELIERFKKAMPLVVEELNYIDEANIKDELRAEARYKLIENEEKKRRAKLASIVEQEENLPAGLLTNRVIEPYNTWIEDTPLLSSLIEEFKAMKTEKVRHTSALEYKANLQFLLDVVGDKQIAQLDRDDILKVEEDLPKGGHSEGTIRGRINYINEFLKWAFKRHAVEKMDIASLLNYKDVPITQTNRAKNRKQEFSREHLEALFSSYIYRGEFPRGRASREDYHFWLLPMLLFTGCRVEEICQLHLDDIVVKNEVLCFDINDNGEKKLKNKQSIRMIPVHNKLLEFGFKEFVSQQRKRKEIRLFPELQNNNTKKKYNIKASRWFNGRFKVKLGMESSQGLDLHSPRHNVTTILANAPIEYIVECRITGHAPDSGARATYLHEADFRQLVQGVDYIQYDVDLTGINYRDFEFRRIRVK